MSLIKKPNELEIPTNIKALFYGNAGTGKTTLALSSSRPLLLDFDGGIHRVNYQHRVPTVQIKNWNEALAVLNENLNDYDSIVVDTIGKMMDFIIIYICGKSAPRIQDWSKINNEFQNFTRQLSASGKHIFFVAHRDIRKEGEDNVFVPALREKNYTAIVTELDLLGYIEMKGNVRTITFDTTSRNDGKNTCNLPNLMNIPTIIDNAGNPTTPNIFLQTNVVNPYEDNLKKKDENGQKYDELVGELKLQILEITDADSANNFIGRIDKFDHIGNSKAVAGNELQKQAKKLGLIFNKESKKYEASEQKSAKPSLI